MSQTCLLGVQLKVELLETLPKLLQESLGIIPVLESNHDIVNVAHNDDVSSRLTLTPLLDPQIEHIMEIDVR